MLEEQFLKTLGLRIKAIRESKGLTQLELAARVDKDQQSIQRLEKGKVNHTGYYLYQIASGLDVDLVYLLDLKDTSVFEEE